MSTNNQVIIIGEINIANKIGGFFSVSVLGEAFVQSIISKKAEAFSLRKELCSAAKITKCNCLIVDMRFPILYSGETRELFLLWLTAIAEKEGIEVIPYMLVPVSEERIVRTRDLVKAIIGKDLILLEFSNQDILPICNAVEMAIYDPAE